MYYGVKMAKTATFVKTGKRLTYEQKLEMIKAVGQGKLIKTVAKVFSVELKVVYYWLERRKELVLQSQAIEQHGKAWLDTKTEREEEIKDLKSGKSFVQMKGIGKELRRLVIPCYVLLTVMIGM